MKKFAVSLVVVGMASVGCKGAAGDGAADGAAPAASAAAGKSCAPGAYKDPNGFYCIMLPDGFKPAKTRAEGKMSVDQFTSGDGFNLTVTYANVASDWQYDVQKQYVTQLATGQKLTTTSAIEDGHGIYSHRREDKEKHDYDASLVESGNKVFKCEMGSIDARPIKPADACKTLHGLL